jgi:hypothetical protein
MFIVFLATSTTHCTLPFRKKNCTWLGFVRCYPVDPRLRRELKDWEPPPLPVVTEAGREHWLLLFVLNELLPPP